jgi:hypothetical protein
MVDSGGGQHRAAYKKSNRESSDQNYSFVAFPIGLTTLTHFLDPRLMWVLNPGDGLLQIMLISYPLITATQELSEERIAVALVLL